MHFYVASGQQEGSELRGSKHFIDLILNYYFVQERNFFLLAFLLPEAIRVFERP
jgi:hypothetical protein